MDADVQAQLHAEETTAAAQGLAFFHGLAVCRCVFQALQPQSPVRGAQAATAVAVALPGAGCWRLHQATVGHVQLNAEGAGGGLFGAVDVGLRQAILPVQAAGRSGLRSQQTLVEAGLLPVAGLAVCTEYPQVHPCYRLPGQLGEQRGATVEVRRLGLQARSLQDGRLHQGNGHGGGSVENFPFVGNVIAGVLVARVDG
ncbi:hypothetical protein D3C76_747550 [compost metagenome]